MDNAIRVLTGERDAYSRLLETLERENFELLNDADEVRREMRQAQEGIEEMTRAIAVVAASNQEHQKFLEPRL